MKIDNNLLLILEELPSDSIPRFPICLCLDTSGSIGDAIDETVFEDGKECTIVAGRTSRISELQKGIELFYETIREDPILVHSAEICIVEFNNSYSRVMDFTNIDSQEEIPKFQAIGNIAMGEGVNLALDLLEKRKEKYRDRGFDYYQSWLILMTDGKVSGCESELQRAIERITQMVNDKKLTVFPIGISKYADMDVLQKFSPTRKSLRLQGLNFKEFFVWPSDSVSKTLEMTRRENVLLDFESIKGWGTGVEDATG